MAVEIAIKLSGSTYSAYRYHFGEFIWARMSLSSGNILYGDSIGFVNGVSVYPSAEKYWNKFDWQPWRKGEAKAAFVGVEDTRAAVKG